MQDRRTPTELATRKVGRLLLEYAIPSIVAMTASSLYNMVDSVFIGHGVGAMAISGLAVTFPLMNLTAAFGSLVGVGAATLTSVKLGQKDYDTASRVLGNVVVLNLILGLMLTVLALVFIDPVLYFFGASQSTIPYARDYMRIIISGNVVTHMYFGLNALLRASGHPRQAMYATLATVLVNIILDPLFIFVFDLGISGAALATVLAQLCSLMFQIRLFSDTRELIHFRKGIFRLRRRIVLDSLSIGISPFLMNLASCMIVVLINNSLKRYGGDLSIGAYGLSNRLLFVAAMLVMGLNQGMQPIAGYNYGALQYGRVLQVLRLTILCGTCVTTTAFLLCMLFPSVLIRAFTSDRELIAIAVHSLRVMSLMFPIVGFQMVSTNFFQSIGKARTAIFLSLTRQLIFLLPCLLFLPGFLGEDGVWMSMPSSDLLSSILTGSMLLWAVRGFRREMRRMEAATPSSL